MNDRGIEMEELDRPRISVVVPVYKVEAYLPKCIDSLVKQTYKDLEIILVDDGSTDRSGQICGEYAARDGRVRVIHQANAGVSAARNAGLTAATGDYIGFVDGDDWIEPDMYERLLKNAQRYGAEISACGIVNERNGAVTPVGTPGRVECLTGRQAQVNMMEKLITLLPSLCNKLYARTLRDALTNQVGVTFTEDMLANYRAFGMSGTVVVDGTPGYHYMLRSGSAVYARVNQGHLDAIDRAEEMLAKVRGDRELGRLWRRRCVALRLTALNRIIKAEKLTEQFGPIRRDLLRDKWDIFTDRTYVLRERAQTLALWLCPGLYTRVVRRKSRSGRHA